MSAEGGVPTPPPSKRSMSASLRAMGTGQRVQAA